MPGRASVSEFADSFRPGLRERGPVACDADQLDETARVLRGLGVRLVERRLEADTLPLLGGVVPAVVADLEVPCRDAEVVVEVVGRVAGRRVEHVSDRA